MPPLNQNINITSKVRLLSEGEEPENLGVMTLNEALNQASSRKFDLSIVNDKIEPAVLKLVDYKQTLYDEFISNYLQADELDKLIAPEKKIKTVTLKPKMGITDLEYKVSTHKKLLRNV